MNTIKLTYLGKFCLKAIFITVCLIIALTILIENGRERKLHDDPGSYTEERIQNSMELQQVIRNTEKIVPCAPNTKQDQFAPCLIDYVRLNLLKPPSGLPLSLRRQPIKDPAIIEKLEFMRKHFITTASSPGGFFIECGANDGEFISPTLHLEREYHWTGLLIEANPDPFSKLVKVHRNAWLLNAALCTTNHSDTLKFYTGGGFTPMGGFKNLFGKRGRKTIDVTCIPFYTVLAAMNLTKVDYLSLDVEGSDLDILKTVPFDKVMFKVMTVEHAHVTGFQMAVVNFLEGQGYKFIGTLIDFYTQDSLFVHESVYTPDMELKIKYQKIK